MRLQAINLALSKTISNNKKITVTFKNLPKKGTSQDSFEKRTNDANKIQNFQEMTIGSIVQNDYYRKALIKYLDESHTMDEAFVIDTKTGLPNFLSKDHKKGQACTEREKSNQETSSDFDGIPEFLNSGFFKPDTKREQGLNLDQEIGIAHQMYTTDNDESYEDDPLLYYLSTIAGQEPDDFGDNLI